MWLQILEFKHSDDLHELSHKHASLPDSWNYTVNLLDIEIGNNNDAELSLLLWSIDQIANLQFSSWRQLLNSHADLLDQNSALMVGCWARWDQFTGWSLVYLDQVFAMASRNVACDKQVQSGKTSFYRQNGL